MKGENTYKALELKTSDASTTSDIVTKGFWFCDLLLAK